MKKLRTFPTRTPAQIRQFERFRAKGSLQATKTLFGQLRKIEHFPPSVQRDFALVARICQTALTHPYWKPQTKKGGKE